MSDTVEVMEEKRGSRGGTERGWRVCELGNVVTFQRGFDITLVDQKSGEIPVVSSSGIKSFHSESMVKGPGVIIGRKGTLGTRFYLSSDFWPHDTTLWIKDFHGNEPRFVYYFLDQFDFEQYDVGSSNPTLNRNHIHLLTCNLPPLPEQRAIASVLSSLDDKIDLLHRQNKTLEALAETLFRQWFVEEADEGWEQGTLRSIANHLKENIIPQKNPATLYHHYSIPAFDSTHYPALELGTEIQSNKYRVAPSTILMSKLNPRFPRVWAILSSIPFDSICSTEFQVIVPVSPEWYSFVYCLLKSKHVIEEMTGAAGGTSGSHQRVKPDDIFNVRFSLPSSDILKEFHKTVYRFLVQIDKNRRSITTLEALRDTLLPKLMSGEVRVAL